jgi:hypothetical protein
MRIDVNCPAWWFSMVDGLTLMCVVQADQPARSLVASTPSTCASCCPTTCDAIGRTKVPTADLFWPSGSTAWCVCLSSLFASTAESLPCSKVVQSRHPCSLPFSTAPGPITHRFVHALTIDPCVYLAAEVQGHAAFPNSAILLKAVRALLLQLSRAAPGCRPRTHMFGY